MRLVVRRTARDQNAGAISKREQARGQEAERDQHADWIVIKCASSSSSLLVLAARARNRDRHAVTRRRCGCDQSVCPALSCSERVPGRPARILQIADVGTEPKPNSGADRREHDITVALERQADAADDVGRAGNAAEALIDLVRIAQVVDQHHDLGAFGAGIVADRGALPVDLVAAGIRGVSMPSP